MFKKLFKRFAKETKTKRPDGVTRIEVDRAKIDRVEIDSALVTKFRDTTTGEIVRVDFNDHKKFNECMSNKNMQIIFG